MAVPRANALMFCSSYHPLASSSLSPSSLPFQSVTVLKRVSRGFGVARWPHRAMNKEAKKEANSTPVSKQEEAPNGFFISEALTDFVPTGTFAPEFVSMPPMERHFNDSVCLADQF